MQPLVVSALRAALAVIALGSLFAQAVIVVVFGDAMLRGITDPLDLLHAAAALVVLGCLQVALVAIWALLSMVRREAIFDERAFRWVPVLAGAGLVAALVVGAVCAQVGELDDAPGLILLGAGIWIAGIAFALLMTVMLGLLRKATALRRELEQVV